MPTPMNYRSSNAAGAYVHFGGALVTGVEHGRGVELNPNSTSASPNIMPAGDDANIGLTVKGKGTGQVTIGDSSNTVALLGTVQVGSTATGSLGFKGAFTALSTFSNAAIAASNFAEFTFTTGTLLVDLGDIINVGLVIDTANASSQIGIKYRASSAASSRLTISLLNTQSTATSTISGTFQISWLDLT